MPSQRWLGDEEWACETGLNVQKSDIQISNLEQELSEMEVKADWPWLRGATWQGHLVSRLWRVQRQWTETPRPRPFSSPSVCRQVVEASGDWHSEPEGVSRWPSELDGQLRVATRKPPIPTALGSLGGRRIRYVHARSPWGSGRSSREMWGCARGARPRASHQGYRYWCRCWHCVVGYWRGPGCARDCARGAKRVA